MSRLSQAPFPVATLQQFMPRASGGSAFLISDFTRMKSFLKAWARGISIGAYLFCLSLVMGVLGFVVDLLPPIVAISLWIVFGPPVIYWVSRWLAPDLFGELGTWWRRKSEARK